MGTLIGFGQAHAFRGLPSPLDELGSPAAPEKNSRCIGHEPRLAELLDDPTLHLLMRKDKVKRTELMALISRVSRRLDLKACA